jgi:hypothetical protein
MLSHLRMVAHLPWEMQGVFQCDGETRPWETEIVSLTQVVVCTNTRARARACAISLSLSRLELGAGGSPDIRQ